jgi:hypothetical protein
MMKEEMRRGRVREEVVVVLTLGRYEGMIHCQTSAGE